MLCQCQPVNKCNIKQLSYAYILTFTHIPKLYLVRVIRGNNRSKLNNRCENLCQDIGALSGNNEYFSFGRDSHDQIRRVRSCEMESRTKTIAQLPTRRWISPHAQTRAKQTIPRFFYRATPPIVIPTGANNKLIVLRVQFFSSSGQLSAVMCLPACSLAKRHVPPL